MRNRDKLIKLINAIEHCSPILKAEIYYHYEEVEHEDSNYDIADAFEDAADLMESDLSLFKYLKEIYIEIGYAIPVDVSKIQAVGGPKYWFIKDGQHYECADSWNNWINC